MTENAHNQQAAEEPGPNTKEDNDQKAAEGEEDSADDDPTHA